MRAPPPAVFTQVPLSKIVVLLFVYQQSPGTWLGVLVLPITGGSGHCAHDRCWEEGQCPALWPPASADDSGLKFYEWVLVCQGFVSGR